MNTVKKYLRLVAGAILINGFIISCKEDDNSDFIVPITHNFKVTYGKDYEQKPVEKAQIILTNNEDGKTYNATTDTKGIAQLEVIPGTYKVNISRTLTTEEYEMLFGQKTEQKITFNGSVENLKINLSAETETTIEMVTGKIGNLIFKQIYYAGSDIRDGAMYRDQFFELHNNSNQTQYLDGLYFAQIKGTNSVSSTAKDYYQPSGQYDWSKSIGQKDPEKANTDYVYAEEVIQFPGDGDDYPIESGKSIIVAATAINHKKPLPVTEGGKEKTYQVAKPELTVDLSHAQFECYFKPYQEEHQQYYLSTDIDNPDVPNMKIAFKTFRGRDLILDTLGRDGFVIFRDDRDNKLDQYNTIPLPSITSVKETTDVFKQIPINVIIDGVDVLSIKKQNPKRIPNAVDAGQIGNPKGAYSSQSIIRKISSQKDGKVFYQDTNNSTNDFNFLNHPQVDIE